MVYKGLELAREAVSADKNCAGAHRAVGMLIGASLEFKNTSEKIKEGYEVRDRFQSAIDLDGSDPWASYLMGEWCMNIAALSWMERKAAAALFGTPPEATYEDALRNYQNAEKIKPGFYNHNQVRIGEIYLIHLGDREAAAKWINSALKIEPKREDERAAFEQAQKLKRKL